MIESWSLTDDERKMVGNKSGPTRLGFALALKFFEIDARFPERHFEFPAVVVDYMAKQVRVEPTAFSAVPVRQPRGDLSP